MEIINQFERVVLTVDLPEVGLEKGDIGTVVDIYEGGKGYEVEFITLRGRTIAVETLLAHQVRAAKADDVPHVRELEAA
jgi:hypothetical protein